MNQICSIDSSLPPHLNWTTPGALIIDSILFRTSTQGSLPNSPQHSPIIGSASRAFRIYSYVPIIIQLPKHLPLDSVQGTPCCFNTQQSEYLRKPLLSTLAPFQHMPVLGRLSLAPVPSSLHSHPNNSLDLFVKILLRKVLKCMVIHFLEFRCPPQIFLEKFSPGTWLSTWGCPGSITGSRGPTPDWADPAYDCQHYFSRPMIIFMDWHLFFANYF